MFINNAQVTVADIVADNGVVHVIDAVLLPPAPPTNTILDVIQNSPSTCCSRLRWTLQVWLVR